MGHAHGHDYAVAMFLPCVALIHFVPFAGRTGLRAARASHCVLEHAAWGLGCSRPIQPKQHGLAAEARSEHDWPQLCGDAHLQPSTSSCSSSHGGTRGSAGWAGIGSASSRAGGTTHTAPGESCVPLSFQPCLIVNNATHTTQCYLTPQMLSEIIKSNVVEDACKLLLLVADEEAERQEAAAAANTDGLGSNREEDNEKAQAERVARLREGQERVVLEEFLSVLKKLVNTASKKAAAHQPAPTTPLSAALQQFGQSAPVNANLLAASLARIPGLAGSLQGAAAAGASVWPAGVGGSSQLLPGEIVNLKPAHYQLTNMSACFLCEPIPLVPSTLMESFSGSFMQALFKYDLQLCHRALPHQVLKGAVRQHSLQETGL